MNRIARKILEQRTERPLRIAYGVMDTASTVFIEGATTAVEVPQLASAGTLSSGDYVALHVSGADAVIIGQVADPGGQVLDSSGVAAGTGSLRINIGEDYRVFADNTGDGSDNTRLWIDGPDGGQVYIGPRSGGETFHEADIRADKVTTTGRLFETVAGGERQVTDAGSNANGQWVRFSNGLQICSYQGDQDVEINAAYGSLFIGSQLFTFPQAFAAAPAMSPGEAQYSTGASWASVYDVTTTTGRLRYYDISSRATASMPTSYIAVGRWTTLG